MQRELSAEVASTVLQAADDFAGYTGTNEAGETNWKQLYTSFVAVLEMMDENNMSLKPSKTVFGAKEMEFFGYVLNEQGNKQAEHNLAPIQRITAPQSVEELRRVLGLFVQSIKRIKWYATKTQPLTMLLKKGQAWKWTATQQQAFDDLKAEILERPNLSPIDWQKAVRTTSDASENGKGGVIYQLKDEHAEDTVANRLIISYHSKGWQGKEGDRPPYYLECEAMLWMMAKGKPFAIANGKKLVHTTDQCPLQWIKKSTKSKVRGWVVEELGGLDEFEIVYKPGAGRFCQNVCNIILGHSIHSKCRIPACTCSLTQW